MDQLTQDLIQARKAGMSYGKWKALQPRVEVVIPKQEEKEVPTQVCRVCGKEIIDGNPLRLYCSDFCGYEAKKVNARNYYYRKKEREENGKV